MRKFVVLAVLCLSLIAAPVAFAAEFYDPGPGTPGKFINTKGTWRYIGPPKNKAGHCYAANLLGRTDVTASAC